jgi:molecular chaperone GrpE
MSVTDTKINDRKDGIESYKEMDAENDQLLNKNNEELLGKDKEQEHKNKKLRDKSKQELLKKITEIEGESEKNYNLYVRTYAEMENIKKRAKKEKEDLAKFANESLIKDILPVIDNLDKAISHAKDNDGNNSTGLLEGVSLTLEVMKKALEKAGLKEIVAEGKPFDPNFHEAILQQENSEVKPGHIIKELQRGYILNGRLIRPSMVIVAQGKKDEK